MDNKLDLWGNITDNTGSTVAVLSLIQEQANLLGTKTNGIIKADFSLIHYQHKKDTAEMVQGMLSTMATLASIIPPREEVVEYDEHQKLEDAGCFYEHGKYKFDIYSDKYKFRLFILDYKSIYPLSIEIEYGILDDNVVTKKIDSLSGLENVLNSIFTSNKVRFVIQKMLELETK